MLHSCFPESPLRRGSFAGSTLSASLFKVASRSVSARAAAHNECSISSARLSYSRAPTRRKTRSALVATAGALLRVGRASYTRRDAVDYIVNFTM
jgi:hypothetical protein